MVKDMTKGAVAPILLKYSLPLLVSVIFQQLYSIADSVIAGQFINKDALAAIGASYPITMIFLAIGTGMNIGCSVVISTLFGAKDYKGMKTAVFTSIISTLVLAAALTIAGVFTSRLFLVLLKTDSVILGDAQRYLNIYVLGLIFLFMYNICTGIFSALGDSSTPLYFLIGSSLGNIALDFLFVAGFKMGVPGTAWATFICQGICSILAFFVLIRKIRSIKSDKAPYFEWRMLKKIAGLSVPSILQQSFVSVGQLFIQGLVNSCGLDVTAGYSSAIKLNTFAVTCFSTVGNSISGFTAQNIGAGEYGRVRKGFKVGAISALCIAAVFALCYVGFAEKMIYIFMDSEDANNAAAAEAGMKFLRIVSPFFLGVCVKLAADGVLRGAGRVREFMITTFSDLILRVIFAFMLQPFFGATGIWLSWPGAWLIAMGLSLTFTFRYFKQPTGAKQERPINKRKRLISIISVIAAFAVIIGVFGIYASDYYHADPKARIIAEEDTDAYTAEYTDNGIVFSPNEPKAGLIFYPGGKVEYTAYAPLMAELAERGVLCVLVKMPFNLAIFDINAADGIREDHPQVTEWYIGGHSLGGAMAAIYASNHLANVKGLLLLGAYSTADLTDSGLNVVSLYGSEDKVLNLEKYEQSRSNLPADFAELVIEGGCHSYFGDYGMQDGDGEPALTRAEQFAVTAQFFTSNL